MPGPWLSTVQSSFVSSIEVHYLTVVSTKQYIEFKHLGEFYEKQINELHKKPGILTTRASSKAFIDNSDLKIYISSGRVKGDP